MQPLHVQRGRIARYNATIGPSAKVGFPLSNNNLATQSYSPQASYWPEHFPSCCPPANADYLAGTIMYLVLANPPTPEDFASAMERNVFKDRDPCLRAGLSCGLEAESLLDLKRNAKRLRQHQIASAELRSDDGMIQKTLGPGHYTMWLRASTLSQAHLLFKVKL
jgi:hypothetical protein